MKIRKLVFILGILIAFLGFEGKANANVIDFAVEPVLPNNQISDESNFFHLKIDQGQHQALTIKLFNNTAKKITLNATASIATTNVNGVVDYSPTVNQADASFAYSINDLVDLPTEILLEANETKDYTFEVKMPANQISGVLAFGITFQSKAAHSNTDKLDGTTINNQFAYVVAVLMQQDEQISDVPELKLATVSATQLNNRNAIVANYRNLAGAYLNQMKVVTKIYQKSTGKLVYEQTKIEMQMAPNSHFDYPIFLNGAALKAGDYQYQSTVYGNEKTGSASNEADKYDYQWSFKNDFKIETAEAKALNQTDAMVASNHQSNILLIVLAVMIVLLLIVIAYLLTRKKINKDLQ
ncbi:MULTISPECIES: DUF916 and DUF3324 domain-containing protein [unclassified Enterococcus]|uniref:DUF916 and DUF3324 domain-containing protein n=1 Tax=unclassified Enterococcus TaxID=2608891 RepID=UPI001553C8E6|nr:MULTISPECIES: DUF916 and DUF3324 domain-containing protein [unclassified Enterococcus]MBS7576808.1 DUF916 and DUF3324 domain-containing protein [Enterococcus sp. MMGLQ5-2]MBS7584215.1 DUF916 and DUF3324 domain-containing protein [Enterococcus sp. MMGLQ5-1]NPD12071.1 DUF916 and DUF3324 domain-containing protein [Enterococcus sp. MMGLQ5-1]NPD36643.1 DUF916 and DUF3324 domain-containing protein [Enterococcus sp. MMGLQ5-2]